VEQISTYSPWKGPYSGAGGCLKEAVTQARGEPMLEQAPARTCGPVETGAHAGAGFMAGLVTPWGPTLEQPVPEGLHPVGRDPRWGSL